MCENFKCVNMFAQVHRGCHLAILSKETSIYMVLFAKKNAFSLVKSRLAKKRRVFGTFFRRNLGLLGLLKYSHLAMFCIHVEDPAWFAIHEIPFPLLLALVSPLLLEITLKRGHHVS